MANSVIKLSANPKWSEFRNVTTDSHGRVITSIDVSNIYIVKAWVRLHSYIVLSYIFRNDNVNYLNFVVIDSETFSPVANTELTIEFYYVNY